MSDSIIYNDGKTEVSFDDGDVCFEQQGRWVRVSRAAMNEIVRGYEREKEQEREVTP